MSDDVDFSATATWGSRREGPEDLAERWIKLITRLQALNPVFADWYYWLNKVPFEESPTVAFKPNKLQIKEFVESYVGTNDDDGSPQPLYGYHGFMCTNESDSPRSFSARISAGTGGPYCFNTAVVGTDCCPLEGIAPDPRVVTYTVFKGIVLALADAFEPACARACPVSIFNFWPRRDSSAPAIELAWITYAGPRYAHLITPPSTAIVEYQSDGGLLMAATSETFDVSNPTHMAVARDIEAAAAPFNVFTQQEWVDVIEKGYQ
jgi:hypothetical protein